MSLIELNVIKDALNDKTFLTLRSHSDSKHLILNFFHRDLETTVYLNFPHFLLQSKTKLS